MLTNIAQVKSLTNKDVTNGNIAVAQAIIESVAGRLEEEVVDPDDLLLMAKATAYQAVYMIENAESVFEQVAIVTQAQMDGSITLDSKMMAPWVAPLAVITLRNVSWRRSRSVKTGPIFGRSRQAVGWEFE